MLADSESRAPQVLCPVLSCGLGGILLLAKHCGLYLVSGGDGRVPQCDLNNGSRSSLQIKLTHHSFLELASQLAHNTKRPNNIDSHQVQYSSIETCA